ncbi:MAG: hypothetical protein KR126chlam3_01232 [Chlamydiae bacterium]|nr:hypothetical protein [Chlamydiota bacterium]
MRLKELDDIVDYFVILEGSTSYIGKPKPLFLAAHINELEKYKDKIIHIMRPCITAFGGGTLK